MDRNTRARLRHALVARYPWVTDREWGPAAVEAGECDGCGAEARLVRTCGPASGEYVGRRCAAALGPDAWCDGHEDDAASALAWLSALPGEADLVARVWWVATGEVAPPPGGAGLALAQLGMPAP